MVGASWCCRCSFYGFVAAAVDGFVIVIVAIVDNFVVVVVPAVVDNCVVVVVVAVFVVAVVVGLRSTSYIACCHGWFLLLMLFAYTYYFCGRVNRVAGRQSGRLPRTWCFVWRASGLSVAKESVPGLWLFVRPSRLTGVSYFEAF